MWTTPVVPAGDISFATKNASTITIRIGNRAPLKTRFIVCSAGSGTSCPRLASVPRRLYGQSGLIVAMQTRSAAGQRGDIGKVAVTLVVVESVADREAVGDLESHVPDGQLDLAASRLGQ